MQELYDKISTWLSNFFQHPAVMWITNITLIFIYVLVVFSKTSLGKKLFNKALKKAEETKEFAIATKKMSDDFQKQINDTLTLAQQEYEKRLSTILSYTEELEKVIHEIGETIPNQKVKEVIKKFESEKDTRKQAILETMVDYAYIDELRSKSAKIEQQIEDRVKEEVDKYQKLYDEKVKEIDALIETYESKLEVVYEETKDTDTEKETTENDF